MRCSSWPSVKRMSSKTSMQACTLSSKRVISTDLLLLDRGEMDVDIPQEVIEEGSKLIEQMLQTWVSQTTTATHDGEDAVMSEDQDELSPEAQLAALQKCVEQFRPQLERNMWAQKVLESLA
jgi:hypothetical protein